MRRKKMSVNLIKANNTIREAEKIIILRLDPSAGTVTRIVKTIASIEFFPDGSFVVKDQFGRCYPSETYIADEKGFEIFGDWRKPVTCWTTRWTLYKKAYKAYIVALNARLKALGC